MKKYLPSLITLAVLLAVWQLVIQAGWIANYLVPSPLQVWQALHESPTDFLTATLSTLKSTAFGFLMSAFLGFSVALALTTSNWLKSALLPFAVFFQTVPVIAIAPLLVIWFGFGEPTVRASALIVSFFPVLANSLVGLGQTDPALRELFQSYRASRVRTLWSLQIPASLPAVFSGLQVAAGLAVIGAIVGEFIAGGGLGGMIDSARTQQRVDLVFAAILISSFMGMLFVGSVRGLARLLLKVRPFYQPDLF